MQMVCISRGSYGFGKLLAEKLAAKLGSACLSREELTDLATRDGIPVGKIEVAILKRQPLTDALAVEIDRFKAFVVTSLCERAKKGGLVYHGRTGHLVMQGLPHVLRVRALADMETRIGFVEQRLKLTPEKARRYIQEVDEDHRRWVRALYNVSLEDPSLYDVTIGCSRMSIDNSATSLMHTAQLPDFEPTPVARQVLEDLLLAARCRLAIGRDERTRGMKVSVHADQGTVSVTYPPWQSEAARSMPTALEGVYGVRSLICTVATTSILYIQERFDPGAASLSHLIDVAEKWNASVDLVRLVPGTKPVDLEVSSGTLDPESPIGSEALGGILPDTPVKPECEEMGCGVPETMDRLITAGRAGAYRTVHGGHQQLASSLSRAERHSLIAVGDVFLGRPEAVRKRMKRELIAHLSDHFRVPVVASDELKTQYLFGARQWASLVLFGALTLALYAIVFTHQQPIIAFLSATNNWLRAGSAIGVALFSALAASIIGTFTHNLLKLVRLE